MSNFIGGGPGANGVNKIGEAATGGVSSAATPGTSEVPTGLAYVAATAQQVRLKRMNAGNLQIDANAVTVLHTQYLNKMDKVINGAGPDAPPSSDPMDNSIVTRWADSSIWPRWQCMSPYFLQICEGVRAAARGPRSPNGREPGT